MAHERQVDHPCRNGSQQQQHIDPDRNLYYRYASTPDIATHPIPQKQHCHHHYHQNGIVSRSRIYGQPHGPDVSLPRNDPAASSYYSFYHERYGFSFPAPPITAPPPRTSSRRHVTTGMDANNTSGKRSANVLESKSYGGTVSPQGRHGSRNDSGSPRETLHKSSRPGPVLPPSYQYYTATPGVERSSWKIPNPSIRSFRRGHVESLGPPHLRIYRASLPFDAKQAFDRVMEACDRHAASLVANYNNNRHSSSISSRNGWETNLYSLTKQDIALADVPEGLSLVASIQAYIKITIRRLYKQPILHMDRNQPHVLKYDGNTCHRSVPLHHDLCHVTANLMMSDSSDYEGGGTYLDVLQQRVVLEQGEFLLHPGNLIHAGCEITSGTRYLMVSFVHFPAEINKTKLGATPL